MTRHVLIIVPVIEANLKIRWLSDYRILMIIWFWLLSFMGHFDFRKVWLCFTCRDCTAWLKCSQLTQPIHSVRFWKGEIHQSDVDVCKKTGSNDPLALIQMRGIVWKSFAKSSGNIWHPLLDSQYTSKESIMALTLTLLKRLNRVEVLQHVSLLNQVVHHL